MKIRAILILVLPAFLASAATLADDHAKSGFMDDYTQLQPVPGEPGNYLYLAPDVLNRISKFRGVMVDQPEIFIADDSPYKGAKPDELVALSNAFRDGLTGQLAEDYYVVEQVGENVLYFGIALSNLSMTKKKRRLIGYTPVGLVGGAVKNAAITNIANKANLESLVIEAEVIDSETGEVLLRRIDTIGADSEMTWQELEELAVAYGNLIKCRLQNSRLAEGERAVCAM